MFTYQLFVCLIYTKILEKYNIILDKDNIYTEILDK